MAPTDNHKDDNLARISLDRHLRLTDSADINWWNKLNVARDGKGETRYVFQVSASVPEMAYILSEIGLFLRRPNALLAKHREAAILSVAQQGRCGYVFAHHTPDALRAGISQHDIDAIKEALFERIEDAEVMAVVNYAHIISATGRCPGEVYNRMKAHVGEEESVLCLLTVNIAHYASTVRILGAFDVRLEDGRQIFEDGS